MASGRHHPTKLSQTEPRQRTKWDRSASSDHEDIQNHNNRPGEVCINTWGRDSKHLKKSKGNPEREREQSLLAESPSHEKKHHTPSSYPRTKITPNTPTSERVALESLKQHMTFSDIEDDDWPQPHRETRRLMGSGCDDYYEEPLPGVSRDLEQNVGIHGDEEMQGAAGRPFIHAGQPVEGHEEEEDTRQVTAVGGVVLAEPHQNILAILKEKQKQLQDLMSRQEELKMKYQVTSQKLTEAKARDKIARTSLAAITAGQQLLAERLPPKKTLAINRAKEQGRQMETFDSDRQPRSNIVCHGGSGDEENSNKQCEAARNVEIQGQMAQRVQHNLHLGSEDKKHQLDLLLQALLTLHFQSGHRLNNAQQQSDRPAVSTSTNMNQTNNQPTRPNKAQADSTVAKSLRQVASLADRGQEAGVLQSSVFQGKQKKLSGWQQLNKDRGSHSMQQEKLPSQQQKNKQSQQHKQKTQQQCQKVQQWSSENNQQLPQGKLGGMHSPSSQHVIQSLNPADESDEHSDEDNTFAPNSESPWSPLDPWDTQPEILEAVRVDKSGLREGTRPGLQDKPRSERAVVVEVQNQNGHEHLQTSSTQTREMLQRAERVSKPGRPGLNPTYSPTVVTFASSDELYSKIRRQQILHDELQIKKRQLRATMKKDQNKGQFYSNQDNQSDTVSLSTDAVRASRQEVTQSQQLNVLDGIKTNLSKTVNTAMKQLDTSTKQPDTATKQLDTGMKQLDTGTKQPDTATKQPDTAMKQPDTLCKQLNISIKTENGLFPGSGLRHPLMEQVLQLQNQTLMLSCNQLVRSLAHQQGDIQHLHQQIQALHLQVQAFYHQHKTCILPSPGVSLPHPPKASSCYNVLSPAPAGSPASLSSRQPRTQKNMTNFVGNSSINIPRSHSLQRDPHNIPWSVGRQSAGGYSAALGGCHMVRPKSSQHLPQVSSTAADVVFNTKQTSTVNKESLHNHQTSKDLLSSTASIQESEQQTTHKPVCPPWGRSSNLYGSRDLIDSPGSTPQIREFSGLENEDPLPPRDKPPTRKIRNRSACRSAEIDSVCETLYTEAASLISQNESRPYFLLELLRRVRQIDSDWMMVRTLSCMQDLLWAYNKFGMAAWPGGGSGRKTRRMSEDKTGRSKLNHTVHRSTIDLDCDRSGHNITSCVGMKELDHQVKNIMMVIVPVVRQHKHDVCSSQLLSHINSIIISRIIHKGGQEYVRLFQCQLAAILGRTFQKYEGKRMNESCEDLLVDIADVVYHELAYLRLIQTVDAPRTVRLENNRQAEGQGVAGTTDVQDRRAGTWGDDGSLEQESFVLVETDHSMRAKYDDEGGDKDCIMKKTRKKANKQTPKLDHDGLSQLLMAHAGMPDTVGSLQDRLEGDVYEQPTSHIQSIWCKKNDDADFVDHTSLVAADVSQMNEPPQEERNDTIHEDQITDQSPEQLPQPQAPSSSDSSVTSDARDVRNKYEEEQKSLNGLDAILASLGGMEELAGDEASVLDPDLFMM